MLQKRGTCAWIAKRHPFSHDVPALHELHTTAKVRAKPMPKYFFQTLPVLHCGRASLSMRSIGRRSYTMRAAGSRQDDRVDACVNCCRSRLLSMYPFGMVDHCEMSASASKGRCTNRTNLVRQACKIKCSLDKFCCCVRAKGEREGPMCMPDMLHSKRQANVHMQCNGLYCKDAWHELCTPRQPSKSCDSFAMTKLHWISCCKHWRAWT